MPKYLATGRTPEGRSVTEELECRSADEAVRIMEERGYGEVVLHTDDVWAHYHNRAPEAGMLRPRDLITIRNLPRRLAHFIVATRLSYQKAWVFFAFCLALLAYRRWERDPWALVDTLVVVLLLSPMLIALATSLLLRPRPYDELMEAVAWGRWEEALARLDRGDVAAPPEELAFRRAGALAGLGRLDEALAAVAPFRGGAKIPEWLYLSRLAGVYFIARRPDEGLAAFERAAELSPDNATILLDYAQYALQHRGDVPAARRMLSAARSHALSDILQPAALSVEGQIHLAEQRPREARALLQSALDGLSRFRFASPLVPAVLDRIRAYLAIACAECGDAGAAARLYRKAEPRLRALGHDDLIERCERAIGRPSGGA